MQKTNKLSTDPSSYRPLCLLDVEGKLFEQLVVARLEAEIERTGGLSDNQFGFRKGRQTIDAIKKVIRVTERATSYTWKHRKMCAVITLDVRNAFNSASWQQILEVLRRRGIDRGLLRIIESYLSDRKILLEKGTEKKVIEVYRGVPQGSILGPTLWNLLYDDLFRLDLPYGVIPIGYADDVAITITAKTENELMGKGNAALGIVEKWLTNRKLELAPSKSEAVILTRKRKIKEIRFEVKGEPITPVGAIKYLGVWLDTKMSFKEHIRRVSEKVGKTTSALARLMPNIDGPKASKRRILISVVHSKILYAAPIWFEAADNQKLCGKLLGLQRVVAIRVCSAYRSISTAAVGVIAAIAPIDLMALERKERFEGATKSDANRTLLERWQVRWDHADTGRWTYRLIPSIHLWISRPYGEVDYYLTQAISGHGTFKKYLYGKKKRNSAECNYCREEDDAQHTLFHCIRWEEYRQRYLLETGARFDLPNMRAKLISREREWQEMYDIVRNILKTKEDEERHERQ